MKRTVALVAISAALGFGFVLPAVVPSGQVIVGIDGNYGYRAARARALEAGAEGWTRPYAFGKREHFGLHTFLPMLRAFGPAASVPILCAVSWAVSIACLALLLLRFGLATLPSLFGGIAFGLTPHFATLVHPTPLTVLAVPAFVAITLLALHVAIDPRARSPLAAALLAGAAWGMLLNEDPQRGAYFSLLFASFLGVELWRGRREAVRGRSNAVIARLAVAAVVALGVFAAQLDRWATSAYVQGRPAAVAAQGDPAALRDFATSWSHHPAELIDAVAPGFHGDLTGDPERPYVGHKPSADASHAIGVLVVLLAALGVACRWRTDARVRLFAVAFGLSTLLAMGRHPPGSLLHDLWLEIPGMLYLRAPMKFMAVSALCLAVLSGFGLQALLEAVRNERVGRAQRIVQAAWGTTAFAAFTTLVLLLVGGPGAPAPAARADLAQYNRMVAMLWTTGVLGAASVCLALAMRNRSGRGDRAAPALGVSLLALLVLDLHRIDSFYLSRAIAPRDELVHEDELTSFLRAQQDGSRAAFSIKLMDEGRIVTLDTSRLSNLFVSVLSPYYDIPVVDERSRSRRRAEDVAFHAALLPRRTSGGGQPGASGPSAQEPVHDWFAGQLRFWQLASVRYVVTDGALWSRGQRVAAVPPSVRSLPGLKLAGTFTGPGDRRVAVLEVAGWRPPVRHHPGWRSVPSLDEAMRALGAAEFDPSREVVVVDRTTPSMTAGETTTDARVHVRRFDAESIDVEVASQTPGVLTISREFDPAWRVRVDGIEAELLRAQGRLLGVRLPAGTRQVALDYDPPQALRAFSRAVLGLSVVAAVVLAGAARFRLQPPQTDRPPGAQRA